MWIYIFFDISLATWKMSHMYVYTCRKISHTLVYICGTHLYICGFCVYTRKFSTMSRHQLLQFTNPHPCSRWIYMYVCKRTLLCNHINMHVHWNICIRVYICVQVSAEVLHQNSFKLNPINMHVHAHICICVCIYVYV